MRALSLARRMILRRRGDVDRPCLGEQNQSRMRLSAAPNERNDPRRLSSRSAIPSGRVGRSAWAARAARAKLTRECDPPPEWRARAARAGKEMQARDDRPYRLQDPREPRGIPSTQPTAALKRTRFR